MAGWLRKSKTGVGMAREGVLERYYRFRGWTPVRVGAASALIRTPTREAVRAARHSIRTERPVLEAFVAALRPDDVVYDIGANVGVYASLASAVGVAHVVAIEPFDDTRAALSASLARTDGDYDVESAAFSDETGRGELTTTDGMAEVRVSSDGDAEGELVRGDEFIGRRDLPRPSVCKIDVEGHESAVLDGLSDVLDSVRLVVVETHASGDPEAVRRQLTDHGFSVSVIHDRGGQLYYEGERRTRDTRPAAQGDVEAERPI